MSNEKSIELMGLWGLPDKKDVGERYEEFPLEKFTSFRVVVYAPNDRDRVCIVSLQTGESKGPMTHEEANAYLSGGKNRLKFPFVFLGSLLPRLAKELKMPSHSGLVCRTPESVLELMRLRIENHWGEHPKAPKADWLYEVRNGDTLLGYWEWAEHKVLFG